MAEPLKLRSSGLGSGIGKDDYTVFTREWEIGRIYQTRAGERRCPAARALTPFHYSEAMTSGQVLHVHCQEMVAAFAIQWR